MTLSRELIQIVEIDIERCSLTYAAASSEPTGSEDVTKNDGDTVTTADYDRSADVVVAFDVVFDASPVGCIWESGGTSTGNYLGVTGSELVWRFGNGGSLPQDNAVDIRVPVAPYVGLTVTIIVEVNLPRTGRMTIIQSGSPIAGFGGVSVTDINNWTGTGDGAIGEVNGNAPTGESTADFNGTISEARFYNTNPVTPGCKAILGTTGVRKCYNTFFTCQDTPNFTTTTETLRFAQNVDGLPFDERIYPALSGAVSTNPTKINLGGVNVRSGALGKRARVVVNFQDFADSDIWFDQYRSERVSGAAQTDEGGYNPSDRGTFFAKLRRRFPYYVGRPLRVLEGQVGDSLASMRTRNYVITEWKGPNAAGQVQITAQDVLDLADNVKAQAPQPSTGKMDSDIDDTSLSVFDLLPAGVGADYPSSGRASIGSEVVSYTRSSDTITLTARGLDGSTAATHSIDDLFQEAFRVEEALISDTVYDLFVNFAGIDPAFITLADWQDEEERWLQGFLLTNTVTKPTGVNLLAGEISQLGVMFWWDEVNQKIRMRANRPLEIGETAPELSDSVTFIEDTIQNEDLHKERLSRVLYWTGQLDVTGSAMDGNNFARVQVAIDADAESAEEYNQTQIYEVFQRWLGVGDDSVSSAVAARLLNRYRNTPTQITFTYDAKDDANVVLGSPVEITSRVLTDDTGNALPTQMQITSIEEISPDNRLRATAQSYQFDGRYGFITENSRANYAGSSDAEKLEGTYIVDEGTLVFASDGSGPYLMF